MADPFHGIKPGDTVPSTQFEQKYVVEGGSEYKPFFDLSKSLAPEPSGAFPSCSCSSCMKKRDAWVGNLNGTPIYRDPRPTQVDASGNRRFILELRDGFRIELIATQARFILNEKKRYDADPKRARGPLRTVWLGNQGFNVNLDDIASIHDPDAPSYAEQIVYFIEPRASVPASIEAIAPNPVFVPLDEIAWPSDRANAASRMSPFQLYTWHAYHFDTLRAEACPDRATQSHALALISLEIRSRGLEQAFLAWNRARRERAIAASQFPRRLSLAESNAQSAAVWRQDCRDRAERDLRLAITTTPLPLDQPHRGV